LRTDLRSFLLGHLPSMPSLTFADDPGDTRRVGLPGSRYARAALGWLPRFIDERLPQLTEVALAASALAELRRGRGTVGVEVFSSSVGDRSWRKDIVRPIAQRSRN
jgi:hypothetical protein